jgi:hypothetical protein
VRKIESRRKLRALDRFRQPDRSEWFFLLGVIVFLVLLVPFQPYDGLQRSATALANAKPYHGDAVIIAIDQQTESGLTSQLWSERDLATLVQKVGAEIPSASLSIDNTSNCTARRFRSAGRSTSQPEKTRSLGRRNLVRRCRGHCAHGLDRT